MFVPGVVQWIPRIEVCLWESGVLTKEVPSSKDSAGVVGEERKISHKEHVPHSHVVDPGLRISTVVDVVSRQVSKIRIAAVKQDITGHGHVEAGDCRDCTSSCLPVGQYLW